MSTRAEEKSKNEQEAVGDRGPSEREAPLGRCYEICIGAQLGSSWSEWFEGLEMRACGESRTVLCGRVADQAALLGILNKLCRLNLPLISVNEVCSTWSGADPREEGGEQ